jgi:hypothetical protein
MKTCLTKVVFVQSMLLSKALKMQQDLEDKKHEVIIENLESKIKEQSAAITINFTLSPSILDDIPDLARSISNRFVKMIWTKGGREKARDEARSHLEPVRNHTLCLPLSSCSILTYNNLILVG